MAFTRYGARWPDDSISDLEVHLHCIRKGGSWTNSAGAQCGLGLYEHYKAAMQLLWPEDDFHRWVDDEVRLLSDNIISVVLGASDSGKTYVAGGKWSLVEYWAAPEDTLVVVSSTDMRGLELRVWGAIKGLFNRALEKFPFLAGRPLESLHCITTDEIDEEQERARTLNRGIVCVPCLQGGRYTGLSKYWGVKAPRLRQVSDECFPAGTMVDTADGRKPIESVSCGDYVRNPLGLSRVLATSSRISESLMRIHLSDGSRIDATPNHPFLTNSGWMKCVDISSGDYLISTDEALHCLQKGHKHQRFQGKVLLRIVPDNGKVKAVQMVRQYIRPKGLPSDFLHEVLRREVEDVPAGNSRPDDCFEGFSGGGKGYQQGHNGESIRTGTTLEADEETCQKDASAENLGWLRRTTKAHPFRDHIVGIIPRGRIELSIPNRAFVKTWQSALLSFGFSFSGCDAGCGSRWTISRLPRTEGKRSREGQVFDRKRVDRVEILKPKGDERYNKGARGYRVYNLQVAGHPSYSVNGLLVHNCALMGEGHLDALPNFVGKDYKGVFLGNPMDPLDPLGRIAEPIDGWDSLKEPTKTTKWKTRMLGGECLNLVGTDSPNFDYPRDEPIKFPYLINWKKIDTVREFWGADSQQYYSQCVGVMKTGLLNKRIITRDICKEHHAFDKAIWEGKPTKKIFSCDAAYGGVGGDRCVAGHIEYGESDTGIEIIKVFPPQIVPVSVKLTTPPEDQIAAWIKSYLDANGIDPNDGFYDSTGRGTLGIAFAKVFKDRPLVPVEFGGRPSNRPVRHDLFTWELGTEPGERKKKRHVRCDEYYVDFVSELWFSSRYVIECDQLRELPEDVMREGCQREFGKQPTRTGTKLFIESKHDPKARERMRRSPDLYDWLVTAIEGARQRGFKIQKLGGVSSSPNDDFNWLKKQADQHRKLFRSKQLAHS